MIRKVLAFLLLAIGITAVIMVMGSRDEIARYRDMSRM